LTYFQNVLNLNVQQRVGRGGGKAKKKEEKKEASQMHLAERESERVKRRRQDRRHCKNFAHRESSRT
jgi:hypothetical protein